MIIDSHCHLEFEENPPEKMIQIMDAGGVDKAVIFAAACDNLPDVPKALLWLGRTLLQSPLAGVARKIFEDATASKPGELKTGGKFYGIRHRPDNAGIAPVIKKYPDRFIGYAFLNPKKNPKVTDELMQCVEEYGMKGVKVHPWFHDYDPGSELMPLARKCHELDIPILMHMGAREDSGNVGAILDAMPDIKLILAHLGIPFFKRSWEQARKYPNLYLDISGPYLSASIVKKAVKVVGAEKLIYGTDGPYGLRAGKGQWSYEPSKAWVEDLPIGDDDKEKIFSKNLLRLLAS